MNFVGRSRPTEVGYAIFIGWVIVMAIMVGTFIWFKHTGLLPAWPGRHTLPDGSRKKKHGGRPKRDR